MAYKTVEASWLIQKFEIALKENWRYVADSAKYGEADCSGIFAYWYAQAGSYMPHGSNSILRKYTVKYGKIGEIELKPGMAVFRWSDDGKEPDQYRSDGLGNFRHIGLIVDQNRTIEMKDSKTGVYEGKISDWHYAAELKNTDYNLSFDGNANDSSKEQIDFVAFDGVVATKNGGSLNLRRNPSTNSNSTILARIPNGTTLHLFDCNEKWFKTVYAGHTGWVSGDYVVHIQPDFDRAIKIDVSSEIEFERVMSILDNNDIDYYILGGDD